MELENYTEILMFSSCIFQIGKAEAMHIGTNLMIDMVESENWAQREFWG